MSNGGKEKKDTPWRHYRALWALLAVAFAIFAGVSLTDRMPTIFGYTPRGNSLTAWLTPEVTAAPPTPLPAVAATPPAQSDSAATDTTARVILFFGDSMLDGLSPRLAAYAHAGGHKLYTVVWYSSDTEQWGRSDRLSGYIARLKPDYIFVCLGSNELNIRDISSHRRRWLDKILATIGDTPYLWIGPPNWKRDTGINAMLAEAVAPGCWFKSDGMSFERRKDGAHPTAGSAALWMDSIVRWMPAHARYPLRLPEPELSRSRPEKVFIHQPGAD